jgi:hypothetical protein
MKHLLLIISAFFLATFAFTSTSCDKKTDCNATVVVVDSAGYVANAKVKLYATVKTTSATQYTADVKAEGITDDAGTVKFTFKLPAIFDIAVTKTASTGSYTYSGTGIIKLEEGKGVEKTVTVK